MTKEDIALVQESWHTMAPVKRVAAELFYVKLFELDHTLQLLLSDDLKLRQQKFLQLMDATVQGLERVDLLMPAIRELGIRHPLFADSEERHSTVVAALMWTLEKCLRKDFTAELKSAWIKTYGVLSEALRSVHVAAAPQAA